MSSLFGPRGHFTPLFAIICLFFCCSFLLSSAGVSAQQEAPCSEESPCRVGCCSSNGICGFTEDHCGDGCLSNCNATAECGQYADEKAFDCPINVCCSKHGFCGITEDFCGDGCQKNSEGGGCGDPGRPSECPVNADPLTYKRRIAYYELFTKDRGCNVKEPESLPLAPLTHLNLAFVNFDSNYKLINEHYEWIQRIVLRKITYPDLRINIAIGGWAFNDPPTATYFSDMVHSADGRATFIDSIVEYLRGYGLDGVDIDWEYPNALDRGGTEGDNLLFNQFLGELRDRFDDEGTGWEISVTLPSSYWYLRGFNLESMQKRVDYFNIMSYDIHGMWDFDNEWTGPYLRGHTNWKEIDMGLDLLWRNGIKPENVVMGFGFYGRAFTMANSGCSEPNGVCEFATGGEAGSCSGEPGILTYSEIASRNNSLDVSTYYDPETTVKYNVFGGDQWVSYDDRQSFNDKLKRLSQRCLSGLMVWAIDQDTSDWQAMDELFGDYSHLQLKGLDDNSAEMLHDLFGQYTGQDCYVTPKCTDGKGEQNEFQVCEKGYMTVETSHNPQQSKPHYRLGACEKGSYRRICCPKASMPKNCKWNGAPERSEFGCDGHCGDGTFQLNRDTAITPTGEAQCVQGERKLCCESTKLIDDCIWSVCQGPLLERDNPECYPGYDYVAYRYNKPDGEGLCSEEYISPVTGNKGSPQMKPFKSALCCPTGRSFSKCRWSNDPPPPVEVRRPELYCYPQQCTNTEIKIADALDPPQSPLETGGIGAMSCDNWGLGPEYDLHFPLCCEPPSIWNANWPVDPEKLWELNFNDPSTDKAIWAYDNHYSNNNRDPLRSEKEDGTDAYGFMMLNGEKEAIDDNFDESHTVVRRDAAIPKMKREILTRNQTIIDNVFEHAEETFMVYCNYPPGSEKCDAVWQGGVEDTIIRLPHHVGEGPFARIVSMKPAGEDHRLPKHHLRHRSLDALDENPVYEVKIDYNFHLARQDRGPVQMRVDYTNLLGYWDELTDSEASGKSSRIKRAIKDDGKLNMRRFRDRIRRGEEADKRLKRRNAEVIKTTVPIEAYPVDGTTDVSDNDSKLDKRWWGIFADWLSRLTTVRKGEKGDLPLEWADEINLFKASWGCPGKSWSANLRMDLQAEITMQATYAYYFSGTFIPPSKPDVFFYFGIEPEATLMLKLTGNAQMRYESQRKKIIDTIGYPGLAVKGIAAVGPTLDIYGQVKGSITIHGEAKAGATVNFGKSEAYWPQDDNKIDEYDSYLELDLKETPKHPPGTEVAPTFEAGVQVAAELDIIVQPEANIGIKIGGGSWTGGLALVDAQVTAYMMGILQLWATGKISTTTGSFDYQYAAYFYYNLGYKAKAVVLEWVDWALSPRTAYSPDRRITIYKQEGSIPLTANAKRMPTVDGGPLDNETMGVDSLLNDDYVFKRADDDSQNIDPDKPKFSDPLKCPAGSSGDIKLPEMRFNCAAFPPLQVETLVKGTYQTLNAMCKGYKQVSGLPMTLTQAFPDSDFQKAALNKRRTAQCPSLPATNQNSCAYQTTNLHTAVGYKGGEMKLECDEFPWASSEEGGTFKDDKSRSQLCIPSTHNALGGNCIALLAFIRQNVGKMEPSIEKEADRKDAWVYWGVQGGADMQFWYTDGNVKGSAKQRFTTYPNKQPIPIGYDAVSWQGEPDTKSWVFKRNYTFSIIDNGAKASSWWDATGKKFNKPYQFKNPAADDYSSVVCGINTFGQDNYYKNPKHGSTADFNGLCFKSKRQSLRGWEDQFGVSRCMIDFGTGGTTGGSATKRSTDSNLDEWDIKDVHIFEDDDIDMSDPDAFLNLMERERAEAEAKEEELRRGGVAETVSPKEGHQSTEESRDVTLLNDAPRTSAEAVDEVEMPAVAGLPFVNKET